MNPVDVRKRKRSTDTNNERHTDSEELRHDNQEQSSTNEIPAKPKRIKKKHQDPSVRETRSKIQLCCARNDLLTAIEEYDKAVANGTRLEAQTFYNMLSLCDGLADRGIHVGTPKLALENTGDDNGIAEPPCFVDEPTRQMHARRIKDHMDELKLPLTETAYTALIKLYSRNKEFELAEALVTEAESVEQCRPKLRMYSALLQAYCEMERMPEALRVWSRLSQLDLSASEKEYMFLIRCSTRYGCVNVMKRVLLDLSEDVLVPSKDTQKAMIEWFQSPFAVADASTKDSSLIDSILSDVKVSYSDSSIDQIWPGQSASGWELSCACRIDSNTGVLLDGCLEGATLLPVSISNRAWQEMKDMNDAIVTAGKLEADTSGVQGGRKGPKRGIINTDERQRLWNAFKNYLEKRCAKSPYDIIIDGANVGYFEQNFQGAPKHVDYHQIDWIVKHFQKQGKRVLLIIHSRHFASNLMPRIFRSLEQSWRESGTLYCTPPGMNDDWFWIHAALHCGRNTHVVTNDEMRDHHFQMLSPRSFVRWKDRHQIHFSFGQWYRDGSREVLLVYPDKYSRSIQRIEDGLVIPRPKRGDEHRFLDGSHIADEDEPEEETYVCIRPKRE